MRAKRRDWRHHSAFCGAHGEFSLQVRAVGQPVGAVVAKDQDTAQRAAKLVRVEYTELPAIVTIEEAIEAGSFYPPTVPEILQGDADAALESAPHVISGSVRSGAQEHFYLETNAVVAVPNKEKVMMEKERARSETAPFACLQQEMVLYVSCQCPTDTQRVAAEAMGVEMNRVVCKVNFELCPWPFLSFEGANFEFWP